MPRPFHKTNRFLTLNTIIEHHITVKGRHARVPTVVTIIKLASFSLDICVKLMLTHILSSH